MDNPKNMNRIITKQDIQIAEQLRKIWFRKKHKLGLTQAIVAKQFGYTQSAISQYISGKIALNADTILKFAKILRCKPEDIKQNFYEP